MIPILFILDIDNTLIGDSTNLINLKYFIEDIKYNYNWRKQLKNTIFIRPYLKEFLIETKKTYPMAEFFIYSVGSKNYVNYIIDAIEEELEFKFNRPLASRDDASISKDTNEWIKDLIGQQSKIFETLERKYGKIDEKTRNLILEERTIIIDDNPNVWNGDIRQIICKKYNYTLIPELDIELIKMIYEDIDIHKTAKEYLNQFIPDNNKLTFENFICKYHINLSNQYMNVMDKNNEAHKDIFFKKFINKIKSRKSSKKIFTKSFFNLNKYSNK